MKKKILYIVLGLVFAVIVLASLEVGKGDTTTRVSVPIEETIEEKHARWDRGEFTEQEIAEIKAEEEREDKALEEAGLAN